MHSSLVRLQNVFGFFTTVAFSVAACISISVLLFPQSPTADLKLRSVQVVKGRPHYYSTKREEYAHIKFDLDADLTSLYNWNTKQLFVYILATYPSASPDPAAPPSQAVIWDQIIRSPAQANPPDPLAHIPFLAPYLSPKSKSKPKAKPKPSSKKTDETLPPGRLALRNARGKYQITDPSGVLAGRGNVTLELGWNVQPWVGALVWGRPGAAGIPLARWEALAGGRSEAFEFPPLKGAKPKGTGEEEGPAKVEAVPKPAEAVPVV